MIDISSTLEPTISHIQLLIMVIAAVLHVLFASGVARDVGNLHRLGIKPLFLSGSTWVMATLIGGILVLAIYWLMHHSSLAKPLTFKGAKHDYNA